MFCNNCGQQIPDNATFCPNCGTVSEPQPQQNQQYQQPQQNQQQYQQYQQNQQYQQGQQQYQQPNQQGQKNAFDNVMDTPDYTASFHPQEIQSGKGMAILCYFGLLVLIPMLVEKNNRFVRFHVTQGFNLFIAGLVVAVCSAILSYVPVIGGLINLLLSLALFVLFILGLVNAGSGKAKELPIIGKFKIIS